ARAAYQLESQPLLDDLGRAIELDPSNATARRTRGRALLGAGQADEAVQDFQYLLEKDARDLESLDAMARALAVQEKFDEALDFVQKMIDAQPDLGDPYALRATIHVMRDENDEALADFNRAVELDPQNPSHLLARANLLRVLEHYQDAMSDVDQVLASRPGLIPAILVKTELLVAEEKFFEAAELLKTVLARSESPELRMHVASLYGAAERPTPAIDMYTEVLGEEDPPWQAYRGRADAFLAIGKHAEAITDYEAALAAQPDDSGILNNLAWVLATSTFDKLRDGPRAIEVAMKACEATEYKQAHILSTLAAGYAEAGKFDDAIEWSTKAVELGEGPVKEQLTAELESYKKGQPWRERNEAKEPESTEPSLEESASLDDLKIKHEHEYIDEPSIRVPADP
ncbi:MAG TPA: tetratricopeptide repeat protein, partial [Pirellulaceae bacterium]